MIRAISIVVFPDFELLDLSGPLCAFNIACRMYGTPYDIEVVSADGGPVTGCAGVPIITAEASRDSDTVMIIGGPSAHTVGQPSPTIALIGELAKGARRVTSVCTGAFFLAAAGLLDGRRATTHWRYAGALQARYPKVRVDADRIFVKDGNVWTSAGITAGIDLVLALIEEDCGSGLAKSVARDLVVYHRRPGGQSQFSAMLDLEPASGRVKNALCFAREHLREPLPVDRLAEAACIGPRQFVRIFLNETGETPARAVERLRAEAARPRIEDGTEPMEIIARDVGFGDVERMRRSFFRIFARSPQSLRRSARE